VRGNQTTTAFLIQIKNDTLKSCVRREPHEHEKGEREKNHYFFFMMMTKKRIFACVCVSWMAARSTEEQMRFGARSRQVAETGVKKKKRETVKPVEAFFF
jgi:hypothetical protein